MGQSSLAVVTGGAAGIGAAVVRRLTRRGLFVVAPDIDPGAADSDLLASDQVLFVEGDVRLEETWSEVAVACAGRGVVGTFVANAARQIAAPVGDLSLADWDAQLQVNLTGTFLGLKTVLPDLRRSGGSAVFVSSVHALVGLPHHPAYAASKAGLVALARQTAVDCAPVRINCVLPGPIYTQVWTDVPEPERRRATDQTLLKRFGDPDEVAAVVDFLCSADASYVTAASIVVDGGWTATRDSS